MKRKTLYIKDELAFADLIEQTKLGIDQLSENQNAAIRQPKSIQSLAALLDAVDEDTQQAIVDMLDMDYLSDNLILNLDLLTHSISSNPILGKKLLSDKRLRGLINSEKKLIITSKDFPEWAEILVSHQDLLLLISNGYRLGDLIEAAPQCTDQLLCNSDMLDIIDGPCEIASVIRAAPHWADKLLSDKDLSTLIIYAFQLIRVIDAAPHWADKLLNDPKMLALIKTSNDYADLLVVVSPKWTNKLLDNKEMLPLLQTKHLAYIVRFAPYLAKRLLSDPNMLALIKKGKHLTDIIIYNPQCADILLTNPKMLALIDDVWQLARILSYAPEYSDTLLRNPDILRRCIKNGVQLSVIIRPQYSELLLTNPKMLALIQNGTDLSMIIIDYPKSADTLLNDPRMLALIEHGDGEDVCRIIYAAPQWADKLLNNPEIRALIQQDASQLARIISDAPQWTETLLKEIDPPALIQDALQLRSFIRAAPQYTESLLANPEMLKLIQKFMDLINLLTVKAAADILLKNPDMLALIECAFGVVEIIEIAPHCANILLNNNDICTFFDDPALLKRIKSDYTLARFIKAAPELVTKYFFTPQNTPYCLSLLTSGETLADILIAVPHLLPTLYPYCHLLTAPEDIARVMCHVCISPDFDDTATLPSLNGCVTWPAGFGPVTNKLLDKLMPCFEKLEHPRSPLMQAYLLVQHVNDRLLKTFYDKEKSHNDQLAAFQQIQKSYHCALTLLTPLCVEDHPLKEAAQYLLITIEAQYFSFFDLAEKIKKAPELKTTIISENRNLGLHLNKLRQILGKPFNAIMMTREKFKGCDTKVHYSDTYGTFWHPLLESKPLNDESTNLTAHAPELTQK